MGNPHEISMNNFSIKIIQEMTSSESKIIYKGSLTNDDPKRRKPDITLAVKMSLDWAPKYGISTRGLQKDNRIF